MQRKLWSALEDSKSCSAEVLFPLVLLRTYEDVKEQRFLATFLPVSAAKESLKR